MAEQAGGAQSGEVALLVGAVWSRTSVSVGRSVLFPKTVKLATVLHHFMSPRLRTSFQCEGSSFVWSVAWQASKVGTAPADTEQPQGCAHDVVPFTRDRSVLQFFCEQASAGRLQWPT